MLKTLRFTFTLEFGAGLRERSFLWVLAYLETHSLELNYGKVGIVGKNSIAINPKVIESVKDFYIRHYPDEPSHSTSVEIVIPDLPL